MIIVSLTSWPKRIGNVATVLKSIVEQDIKADLIQINLSRDEFPNCEGIPDDLLDLMKVHPEIQIEWVDGNDGVFKKIIPTLRKHYGEDYYLISIDDDLIYRSDWIKMLVENLENTKGDSYCPSLGKVVGNRMIYKSSCFEEDFWEKLTPEVIATRIDDMYIEYYLSSHHKTMSHYRPTDIEKMTTLYNPVYPNSHNTSTGSYSAEDIHNARNTIYKIKF